MTCVRTLLLGATLIFASVAPAQFTQVPGYGCSGTGTMTGVGSPQLSQAITYQWACPSRADTPFVMFAPLLPGGFPFTSPIACMTGCTLLFPVPSILIGGPAGQGMRIPVTIPNDPSLINQTLHSQGGCWMSNASCISLGQVLETKILP